MFHLTLMGKSDAVIESFFINMHARCVQVLKNGSESRGFNLGKVKKKIKKTYHWNLIWPAWQAFERKGEVNWGAPFALLMRARNHLTLPFQTRVAQAKTAHEESPSRSSWAHEITLPFPFRRLSRKLRPRKRSALRAPHARAKSPFPFRRLSRKLRLTENFTLLAVPTLSSR